MHRAFETDNMIFTDVSWSVGGPGKRHQSPTNIIPEKIPPSSRKQSGTLSNRSSSKKYLKVVLY